MSRDASAVKLTPPCHQSRASSCRAGCAVFFYVFFFFFHIYLFHFVFADTTWKPVSRRSESGVLVVWHLGQSAPCLRRVPVVTEKWWGKRRKNEHLYSICRNSQKGRSAWGFWSLRGMCSRQERIQKDVDIVIQRCQAEKDCLFSGEFPLFSCFYSLNSSFGSVFPHRTQTKVHTNDDTLSTSCFTWYPLVASLYSATVFIY